MALFLTPSTPTELRNLANLCVKTYRYEEAKDALIHAIAMDSSDSKAYLSLGIVHCFTKRFADAETSLKQAIAIAPLDLSALSELIIIYRNQGSIDLTLMQCEIGLAIEPLNPRLHIYRSLIRLSLFELSTGWSEYQWRFYSTDPIVKRLHQDLHPWDGYSNDRPLVVWREQGIGDVIFHLGFLPQLETLHPDIILDINPRLRIIASRSFPSLTVADSDCLSSICSDYYEVPIASLGMHLGASLEMARKRPAQYLFADAEKVKHFRDELTYNR